MTTTLMNRLARLEGQSAPQAEVETSFTPALRLLRLLIAVRLGDLKPGEDVAAGEARALGFETVAEMRATMAAERTAFLGWGSRHNEAVERMLSARGGGSGAGVAVSRDCLPDLLAALPVTFADHPDADPAALATASEWVSL